MKKSITPVIAVILLIMLTIAVSASAWYWVNSLQANLQSSSQQNIESTTQASSLKYSITSLSCNTSGNITIEIRNNGEFAIPIGEIILIKLLTTRGIELGSHIFILPFTIDANGEDSIAKIQIPSNEPIPSWSNLMAPVERYQIRTDIKGFTQSSFCSAI